MHPTGVLIQVLIQDPSVASSTTNLGSILHPVVVKDPAGFGPGPVCRRVAVVDLDFQSGKLGKPVPFDPKGTIYKGIGAYRAEVPSRQGARTMPWARSLTTRDIAMLGSIEPDDPFLKVSVFGTVVRTLGMIQDPTVLGREVRWAFPGEQLLVVPRAGELDNAFYHRGSRSLQFYLSTVAKGRAVFSGLSQDIVAHETTHAIIDGIAPSLHDAISAESLAIHEGLADITAAMLSVRNRELVRDDPEGTGAVADRTGSSRFSQIAEEFGHWRGYGDSLRDVANTRSLDPHGDKDSRVDGSSPHSLSEVLSGLLFDVFREVLLAAPRDPDLWSRLEKGKTAKAETLRLWSSYASNRVLGLAFRGLDWLPPGEASFTDLVASMLAADRLYFPRQELARNVLVEGAARRHIALGKERTIRLRPAGFDDLKRSAPARAELAQSVRDRLGAPAGARVTVTARSFPVYEPPLPVPGEPFWLTPTIKPQWMRPGGEHLLVKLAWHESEPNEVSSWGALRRYRSGATLVLDRQGRLRALLRIDGGALQSMRRGAFLARLLAEDPAPFKRRIGPDGRQLERGVRASLRGDTLSISGAIQALHVVGDPL